MKDESRGTSDYFDGNRLYSSHELQKKAHDGGKWKGSMRRANVSTSILPTRVIRGLGGARGGRLHKSSIRCLDTVTFPLEE